MFSAIIVRMGTLRKFCQQFKKDREKNKGNVGRMDNSSCDDLLNILNEFNIIYNDDLVNLITNETSWAIDSGANLHATSGKEFFSYYIP